MHLHCKLCQLHYLLSKKLAYSLGINISCSRLQCQFLKITQLLSVICKKIVGNNYRMSVATIALT